MKERRQSTLLPLCKPKLKRPHSLHFNDFSGESASTTVGTAGISTGFNSRGKEEAFTDMGCDGERGFSKLHHDRAIGAARGLALVATRARAGRASISTQVGEFRSSRLGARGSLASDAALVPRIKSMNLLSVSSYDAGDGGGGGSGGTAAGNESDSGGGGGGGGNNGSSGGTGPPSPATSPATPPTAFSQGGGGGGRSTALVGRGSGGAVVVRPKYFCARGARFNPVRATCARFLELQTVCLTRFRELAGAGRWKEIHAGHFDWWMFPIEDGSKPNFNVYQGDVDDLRAYVSMAECGDGGGNGGGVGGEQAAMNRVDGMAGAGCGGAQLYSPTLAPAPLRPPSSVSAATSSSTAAASSSWLAGYTEAAALVCRAWGWDLARARPVEPLEPGMGWTFWDVRLAKMIRSLWLFGCKRAMESLQKFARAVKPDGGLRYGRICMDEVFFMYLRHDYRDDEAQAQAKKAEGKGSAIEAPPPLPTCPPLPLPLGAANCKPTYSTYCLQGPRR